jgi:hypothetical protein
MQIRQSSLIQFGNILVRNMVAAGEQDQDMKYSLDYMHSRYDSKKVLTLISPETGGMVLLGHEEPHAPFTITITANRVVPGDTLCWWAELPQMGIRQSQRFAQWLVGVFKMLSWMDTDDQFKDKINQLFEDCKPLEIQFAARQFKTFQHQLFDI